VGLVEQVAVPINTVLGWIEAGVKWVPRASQRRGRTRLLNDRLEQAYTDQEFQWLSLGSLTKVLGLDSESAGDLQLTAELLMTLPARPSRSSAEKNKPRQQHMWGLVKYVGP
jgi:hypothetical protein